MGNQLIRPVAASELANSLGLALAGEDQEIERVLPLSSTAGGALSFCGTWPAEGNGAVLIAPPGEVLATGSVIVSERPRLDFVRALQWLHQRIGWVRPHAPARIHPDARVSPSAVIGRGVTIGKGTVVHHFVVIGDEVQIGDYCIIKSGAVIGEDGFGFERDESGMPIRMQHLGSVVIGNEVEIGSMTTVCRGALTDTVIEDGVKTDDHVHIAHNCRIGRGALLTACVELSGGVEVGAFAWLGPNSSVLQKVRIGEHAFIGIASNVTRPVAPGNTVAGNPARVFRKAG